MVTLTCILYWNMLCDVLQMYTKSRYSIVTGSENCRTSPKIWAEAWRKGNQGKNGKGEEGTGGAWESTKGEYLGFNIS